MLRWRLLLGVLFIAALLGIFWADWHFAKVGAIRPGRLVQPLAFFVAFLAMQELCDLAKDRVPGLSRMALIVGTVTIVIAAFEPNNNFLIAMFVCAVFLLMLREMYQYDKDVSKHVTERLALGIFGLVYIGLFMAFIVKLWTSPFGPVALASMLVVVKLGDTGAYTVGRLIGRHKLCPKLSPGKTIEGLGGAVLFSCLGAFVIGHFWSPPFWPEGPASPYPGSDPYWPQMRCWLIYGATLSLVGAAGDLVESMLKRDFGVKDSSTWMPGFGGVLDLIDSPLVAAPVAWMMWESGLLGVVAGQ